MIHRKCQWFFAFPGVDSRIDRPPFSRYTAGRLPDDRVVEYVRVFREKP